MAGKWYDYWDKYEFPAWIVAKVNLKLRGLVSAALMLAAVAVCVSTNLTNNRSLLPMVPVSVLAAAVIIGYWILRRVVLGRTKAGRDGLEQAAGEPQPATDPWADFRARQEAMEGELQAKAPERRDREPV